MSIPTLRKLFEIPRMGRVSKAKLFKRKVLIKIGIFSIGMGWGDLCLINT